MLRLASARRSNMNAVGRILTQGVYNFAGPFHPFGGAVDIIVVQQQDGSFKSSPWYVKFGKFQGVLKRSEKVVNIAVNEEALNFHMFLDSAGEAYFLKDPEPDKEPLPLPLAITSGDEVLASEDNPNKSEDGLERKAALEDVERGESSDDQDSNLALRFEGRKASFLLVQQAVEAQAAEARAAEAQAAEARAAEAQAAEARAAEEASNEEAKDDVKVAESSTFEESSTFKEDTGAVEEAELPKSTLLIKDTEVIEEAERPGSSILKEAKDVAGDASNDILSSLAAPTTISAEELEKERAGSLIHALLNRSMGLEKSQQAGCASSLLAQAALAAVSKAAWEPSSEDSSKDIGNGYRDSFEVLNNSGKVIAEGFRLKRSESLNMESEKIVDGSIRIRRVKSESDLRLLESDYRAVKKKPNLRPVQTDFRGIKNESDLRPCENGDNLRELSTLTITSADGVVVLHTPRGGNPPPLTSEEDHIQTLQQPIIFEGDGEEKPLVLGMLAFEQVVTEGAKGDIPVEEPNPSFEKKEMRALITAGSGGWKLWPFPLRRTKTSEMNGSLPVISQEALMVATKAGVDSALMNNLVSGSDYYLRSGKNKVRSFVPTSKMLESMHLKEGKNRITFTFFTQVLGKQQVDARIYLWKWNTRVVISDVDGTITKSDVLGQVMPLVGRDWTQSGVTRLFSAIKENGYEIMFLSARAISQAYLTRQFLLNLKQDGEALPDGPVVISPDGLFPSLYREVIRRAPQEFKIACLQDIRDLFPEECNPFYAGFGNRDTDEISYLKVGIPKGKIFIINPKGEVAVNNRVDAKSYTSLHKLVDDIFPPQTYTEQEDFNTWNYWKMPLPDVEDELRVKSVPKPKKVK